MARGESNLTDAELLSLYAKQQDARAFEILVRRHGPMTLGVCRRYLDVHEAEDAMQAVFIALARKAPELKVDTTLAGWLYRVARHTSLNLSRGKKRARNREQVVASMKPEAAYQRPDEAMQQEELGAYLDDAIMSLNDKDREVVLMHDVQGMTHKEIANLTGSKEGTVSSRLTRAREKLRAKLLKRGVATAAVATPAMMFANHASAQLPESLVKATTQSAGNSAAVATALQVAAVGSTALVVWKIATLVGAVSLLTVSGLWVGYWKWGADSSANATEPFPSGEAVISLMDEDAIPEPDSLALLGPFNWTRSVNLGEDARLGAGVERLDQYANQSSTQELLPPETLRLWLYQFTMHLPDKFIMHARNTLINRDPAIAYQARVDHLKINTSGSHNFRLSMGYVPDGAELFHGDREDLLHRAPFDRVLLLVPMRHDKVQNYRPGIAPPYIFTSHGVEYVSLIQIPAGTELDFDMFRGRDVDQNLLMDLRPYFETRANLNKTQPMFDFQISDHGGWILKVERDGSDGLSGGENPTDWDVVLTHESMNAKPYTVDLNPLESQWAMSTFSPGGSPADSSELWLSLTPYERSTGEFKAYPHPHLRVTDVKGDKASEILDNLPE